MEENIDILTIQTVEELPEGSTVYGNVNDEFVQIPSRVFQQSQGGDGNNPGGTPPNNYVFVAGNDSDNEEPTGEIGKINADFLQGRKAEEFLLTDAVSDKFDETKTYSIGDYCIYTDRLFRFTEAKDAGAWDGAKVIPVTVSGELGIINDDLNNIDRKLTNTIAIVNGINKFYEPSLLYFKPDRPISNVEDIFAMIGKNGVCGIDASVSAPFLPEKHYYIVYINTFGAVTMLLAVSHESSYIGSYINKWWSGWSKFTLTKL